MSSQDGEGSRARRSSEAGELRKNRRGNRKGKEKRSQNFNLFLDTQQDSEEKGRPWRRIDGRYEASSGQAYEACTRRLRRASKETQADACYPAFQSIYVVKSPSAKPRLELNGTMSESSSVGRRPNSSTAPRSLRRYEVHVSAQCEESGAWGLESSFIRSQQLCHARKRVICWIKRLWRKLAKNAQCVTACRGL